MAKPSLIRTINDVIRTLLLQANLTPPFWVEALHTATCLLNHRRSHAIHGNTLYFLLHGLHPTYDHLKVFGCLCYPNLYATTDHKLSPRSTCCIFLGYALKHKGCCYYDLTSRRVIVSRHVVFDEKSFPYAPHTPSPQAPTSTQNQARCMQPHPILPNPNTAPTSYQPPPYRPACIPSYPVVTAKR